MKTSMKEIQDGLVANMQSWQKVEDASVASTGKVIEKTDNPLIQLVMEIIQRDSQMHHRVQKWIADSLSVKAVSLSTDELGEVWEMIEQHIAIEKKTQVLASASLEAAKGSKGMLLQAYLLEYLLEDEKKHDLMLQRLEEIKKGMYPYA